MLGDVQAITARLWSSDSWWHAGQPAWDEANRHWGEPCRYLVLDDAWARVTGGHLQAQAGGDAAAASELVAWAADAVTAEVAEPVLVDALLAAGFEPDDTLPFGLDLRMPAGPTSNPIEVRQATSTDEVVATHRAAWRPAALPFADGHRPPIDDDAESDFAADACERAAAMPTHLVDLIAIATDGSAAGCCTAWLDDRTGAVLIEPLGVVPAHRRRGVAQALVQHVASLATTEAVIQPRGDRAYPAPRGAYLAAGFVEVNRTIALRRR